MMGGPEPGDLADPTVARLRQALAISRGEPLEVVRLKYPDRRRPWTADPMAAARAHGYQPTRRGGLSAEEDR